MHSVIVCEGFQDRAFISEWLEVLAARSGARLDKLKNQKSRDIQVDRAHAKQGRVHQVYVVACEGLSTLVRNAADLVKAKEDHIARLLLVADADDLATEERRQRLLDSFRARSEFKGHLDAMVWTPQLEVLISDALHVTRSQEMEAVDAFLAAAPAPTRTRKEAAFTFCSAWEPDAFGDTFFQRVWQLADVRSRLEDALKSEAPRLEALL